MTALASSSSSAQGGGEQASPSGDDPSIQEQLKEQSRKAIRGFFYPTTAGETHVPETASGETSNGNATMNANEVEENRLFVEQFWKYYDDLVILSIFTQVGILFRLAAAGWFSYFDGTFRADSALFVNLPLNCLSTFLMGCLSSGTDVMSIVETRFSPTRRQEEVEQDDVDIANDEVLNSQSSSPRLERLRRRKRNRIFRYKRKRGDAELREVQLAALERRIRASPSILLFPVKKEDSDLMEHYFADGYQKERYGNIQERTSLTAHEEKEEELEETEGEELENVELNNDGTPQTQVPQGPDGQIDYGTAEDRDLDQIIYDVSASFAGHVQSEARNLSSNLNRLSKVSLADGWDTGTTPEAMCDDLLLGLRDGFCGALSSFSSWNSSMVALIRGGDVQQAIVGYMLGIQLPIVSYRFGQHVAVYIFIWRCRRETQSDERRGYGLRVSQQEHSFDVVDVMGDDSGRSSGTAPEETANREVPSVRAVATALFVLTFVAQVTALFFFDDPSHQLLALSLFFSPFGVLARWRLGRYNRVRPGFPLGTFACNILACALSGSLGTLLAGDPGPRERIVLVAFISGFGGTLSSVASFIVEVLQGVDPLLFRLDGFYYAFSTIFWGMIIGILTESSVDWADQVEQRSGHYHPGH